MLRRVLPLFLCFTLAAGYLLFKASTRAEQPERPAAQPSEPAEQKSKLSQSATPQQKQETGPRDLPVQPAEVQGAVARMYGKAVIIDTSHSPNFVAGDFNGDQSQDIAVVVKPAAGMLPEINSEVANWIIIDPGKVTLPDLKRGTPLVLPQPKLSYVEQSDVLLAVIHGAGEAGWRNPKTIQAFLLRHAVGTNMQSRSRKDLLAASKGKEVLGAPNYHVINVTFGKESRYILWTGAKYVWYAPEAEGELAQAQGE